MDHDNNFLTTSSDDESDGEFNEEEIENLTIQEKARIEKNLKEYYKKNKMRYIPMEPSPEEVLAITPQNIIKKRKGKKAKKSFDYTSQLYSSFPKKKQAAKTSTSKNKGGKRNTGVSIPKKKKKVFSLTKVLTDNSSLKFSETFQVANTDYSKYLEDSLSAFPLYQIKNEVTPEKKQKKLQLEPNEENSFQPPPKKNIEEEEEEGENENEMNRNHPYILNYLQRETENLEKYFPNKSSEILRGITKDKITRTLNYNPTQYHQKLMKLRNSKTNQRKINISKKPKKKNINSENNNRIGLKNLMLKITHLRLEKKEINVICPNILFFKNNRSLVSLYLDSNKIRYISSFFTSLRGVENFKNISNFSNLKFLYLNNNRIQKIENLEELHSLEKLYINHNRISKLESLSKLENLRELYVQNQDIEEYFQFDLFGIPRNLRILDCSSCNIKNFELLMGHINEVKEYNNSNEFPPVFEYLEELRICKNLIDDKSFKNFLRIFIREKYYLESVDCSKNTFVSSCKPRKWKDMIITGSTSSLGYINGNLILENHRKFLKNKNSKVKTKNESFLPSSSGGGGGRGFYGGGGGGGKGKRNFRSYYDGPSEAGQGGTGLGTGKGIKKGGMIYERNMNRAKNKNRAKKKVKKMGDDLIGFGGLEGNRIGVNYGRKGLK